MKRKISVPQNGTQPATPTTAIDHVPSTATPQPTKVATKKPTSFNIDADLLLKFKATCASNGLPMSSAIEELMLKFLQQG